MKKLLPILGVVLFALAGCLREGDKDCPACMNLVFTHNGSTAGFDSRIGNDVELQIYYDGVWHSTRLIPYESIAGGKGYYFRKTKSEKVQLIAYAVPRGGDAAVIPQAAQGMLFTEQAIRMQEATRAVGEYLPKTSDIFAGTLSVEEPSHEQSTHTIPMSGAMCRVDVILEGADLFAQAFPDAGTPSIGLLGTTRAVTTYNKQPDGVEIEVVSGLTKEDDNLKTPVMRVLPSPDGTKTLSVNFYKSDGTPVFPVYDTDEIAGADKDITIIYRMGENSVFITLKVNGWTVRTEEVPIK